MFEDEFARGHLVKVDENSFVERDVLNIIEKIQDYDPNIKVQYLEVAANLNDAPWRLIELCRDGRWRVVFYAWHMNETVLQRLYAADTQRHDILSRQAAHNAKIKSDAEQRYQEDRNEVKDKIVHMLKSPKGRYSFRDRDKTIHIDDDPLRKPKIVRD